MFFASEFAGYRILEKISESSRSSIFRCIDLNNSPVIIKMPKKEHPSLNEIERIEHEFNIIRDIQTEGIIRYHKIINTGHSRAIVMDDSGGISLEEYLIEAKHDLTTLLKIIKEITETVSRIHEYKITHKNINPSNIIINPLTQKITVIDFSIAARLKKEIKSAMNPEKLEGTLAYISPEQTGRMNRSIDFRTDFYSLGITIYYILTGVLPFTTLDPMELIHSHIARLPHSPHQINPEIPVSLSDIVMKLISKAAEDRYQSSYGLKSDLDICLSSLQESGNIRPFKIAQRDIPEHLQIPEKIYGREDEINFLYDEFDKAIKNDTRIVFFAGPSGIGKSYLINELQRPLVEKRGYFISGKFDKYKRNVPYKAFIQAIEDLIKQILSENDEKITAWKDIILNAIGDNGGILLNIVPDLEYIIGKQPEAPRLTGSEIQNFTTLIFQKFITSFASEFHPLVLFLDDLQWSDIASINLLRVIIKNTEKKHLLIIGSYRDNEIDVKHPLVMLFEDMELNNISKKNISLKPLKKDEIKTLLSETFYTSEDITNALAEIVITKTAGNPFFIREFIASLYRDDYIYFSDGWNFAIDQITAAGFTDNVVEFISNRITKVSVELQHILKICACMVTGNIIILSKLLNSTDNEIYDKLVEAVDEGIIILHEENIKFAHDRIQDAVYSLMDKKSRMDLHYRIGKLLYETFTEREIDDEIFSIVQHLNLASELITSEDERILLAELNLKAGLKAKRSAAFNAAFQFNTLGLSLLSESSWADNYALTLALNSEMCETSYLIGDHGSADKYFELVTKNAQTPIDSIHVYEVKIVSYTSLNHPKEAIRIGIHALRTLGFSMPDKATSFNIIKGLIRSKILLLNKNIPDLINLKELNDTRLQAIARILIYLSESSYIGDPGYMPVIVVKLLNLSLKHGNSAYASVAYSFYAIILCGVLADYNRGYQFGKLSLEVVKKYNARSYEGRINFIFGNMINHWKNHFNNDMEYILKGYESSSETGDNSVASYSINHYIFHSFFSGESLDKIKNKLEKYCDIISKYQQPSSYIGFMIWYQIVTNLTEEVEDRLILKGKYFNELITIPECRENLTCLAFFTVGKLILLFLFEAYEDAADFALINKCNLEGVTGMIFVPEYYFYCSLSLTALCRKTDLKKRKRYMKILKQHIKKMKKWAEHCPENYENKYLLIEAEIAVLQGDIARAKALYKNAIEASIKHHFLLDEAIANELSAKFYSSLEMDKFAASFITRAFNLYNICGAKIKTADLQSKYGKILLNR